MGSSEERARYAAVERQPGGYFDSETSVEPEPDISFNSITPATLKQLMESAVETGIDDKFSLDGVVLDRIKVVGKITSVDRQSSGLKITIEDGTAQLQVISWLDPEEYGWFQEHIQVGIYVRCFGRLGVFQGVRNLSAGCIQPLEDHNEITAHNLEALYVYLFRLHGPLPGVDAGNANG